MWRSIDTVVKSAQWFGRTWKPLGEDLCEWYPIFYIYKKEVKGGSQGAGHAWSVVVLDVAERWLIQKTDSVYTRSAQRLKPKRCKW